MSKPEVGSREWVRDKRNRIWAAGKPPTEEAVLPHDEMADMEVEAIVREVAEEIAEAIVREVADRLVNDLRSIERRVRLVPKKSRVFVFADIAAAIRERFGKGGE